MYYIPILRLIEIVIQLKILRLPCTLYTKLLNLVYLYVYLCHMCV